MCRCSPLLTWRDVQHLLVKTSRPTHLRAADWKTNGAGHKGEGPWGGGGMVKTATQGKIKVPRASLVGAFTLGGRSQLPHGFLPSGC